MSSVPVAAPAQAGNLNFVLVCIFLDMLGIGLIVPIMPVLVGEYVSSRDEQSMWFGIIAAVFGLLQFIFMPMLGAISDRVGRRPVLLYSMAGMCINFVMTAWAPSLAFIILARAIGGVSSASMSVAQAYAADISTPENRSKTFGKVGAAFGLGFICGPMIGGVLGEHDLKLPFIVAAALSAINLAYGWLYVPESLPASRRQPFELARINPFAALIRLARRVEIRPLVIVFALATLAQVMLQTTWVLYTTFRFNWSTLDNGIALFCVGLAASVVQAGLLAPLIRQFGEPRLAILGLASGAITYTLYGLATQGWMMYVFILCNLLAFTVGPALQGMISKATAPEAQGEVMGSLQSITSLGLVVITPLGTYILARVSHYPPADWRLGTTFFLCAAMQAVAIVVAARYFKMHHVKV